MTGAARIGSLKLGRPWRIGLYVVGWGTWLSGALWLIAHYFMRVKGQFGFKSNPLEFWWLTAHGAFAVACVFMFGWLWSRHIVGGWTMRWRRWSGGVLSGFVVWLTISGYALYYIGGAQWLDWTSILHWAAGLASLVAFFIHWLSRSQPRRTRRSRA
jgi:hypothetical protein